MKKWEQLKNRKHRVLSNVLTLIALLLMILLLFSKQLFGDNAFLKSILGDTEGGFTLISEWFFAHIGAIVLSMVNIIIVLLIRKGLNYIIYRTIHDTPRGKTAAHLIDSMVKYASAIVIIIVVLLAWGMQLNTLLASVGVLGVVIGLGAQSFIADIISGLFIVFEGDYQVGDIVIVDDFRGTVQSIGVRITKIMDVSGNLKIINNSQIKTLINLSANLSVAVVDVDIPYSESVEHVETIIKQELPEIAKRYPLMVEGPTYLGVSAFNPSGVTLKLIAKTKENDRFQVERDLRREIKLLFDRNHINIPFQTVTIDNLPKNTK